MKFSTNAKSQPVKPAEELCPENYEAIYVKYAKEVRWIQIEVKKEFLRLPMAVKDSAQHYLNKRISTTGEKNHNTEPLHPLVGQPVPYLAFWLCEDFGVQNKQILRTLGLAMVFASISVSARDDLLDGTLISVSHQLFIADYFWARYTNLFGRLFSSSSDIHRILITESIAWRNNERASLFAGYPRGVNPLQRAYLRKSAQYLVSVCYPSLAAVALIQNRRDALYNIRQFLRYYCMGWRIVDDLRDWKDDLARGESTKSSVIVYMNWKLKISIPNAHSMVAGLMDQEVIDELYSTIKEMYSIAITHAETFKSAYCVSFINSQLLGHEMELERLKKYNVNFYTYLEKMQSDTVQKPVDEQSGGLSQNGVWFTKH